jgi:hypothetical protein
VEGVAEIQRAIDEALLLYKERCLDNIDLSRLPSIKDQANVIGLALMERGDGRAFRLGKKLSSFHSATR